MKATINGLIVEGTPEEIVKYRELIGEIRPSESYNIKINTSGCSKDIAEDIFKEIQKKLKKKPIFFGDHY